MNNPQFVPQAIMAGVDVGAMSREQLKALAVSGKADDFLDVVFLIDGAKAKVEAEHPPLIFDSEDERELWREALLEQGLRPWQIALIEDNKPVPGLGPNWQPLWLSA